MTFEFPCHQGSSLKDSFGSFFFFFSLQEENMSSRITFIYILSARHTLSRCVHLCFTCFTTYKIQFHWSLCHTEKTSGSDLSGKKIDLKLSFSWLQGNSCLCIGGPLSLSKDDSCLPDPEPMSINYINI